MKRTRTILFALLCALSFTACGQDAPTGTKPPAESSAVESSPDESSDKTHPSDEGTQPNRPNETAKPSIPDDNHEHTPEIIPATEALCNRAGATEGEKCADCGEVLVPPTEIPPSDKHTFTDEEVCAYCNAPVPYTEGLIYKDTEDGCTVYALGAVSDTDIYIPLVHDGKAVTSIAEEAFADSDIVSVRIPKSVKSVGYKAFKNCKSLVKADIRNGVESIESEAFCGCKSLTELYIGDAVTRIGQSAFMNCSSLREVVIPDSVTSLSPLAFSACYALQKVHIGNGVYELGDYVFELCPIQELTIGTGMMTISAKAFSIGKIKTESVGGVEYVGSWVFSCSKTKVLVLREGTVGAVEGALSTSYAEEIILPNGFTHATRYTFEMYGWDLQSVTLPNNDLYFYNSPDYLPDFFQNPHKVTVHCVDTDSMVGGIYDIVP